ncbi:hypothetical protein CBS101457_003978 [Exobasidium rhododendri]|nr:hypothetical protein CBS101457_003978 [Exobasidium rhododendri]
MSVAGIHAVETSAPTETGTGSSLYVLDNIGFVWVRDLHNNSPTWPLKSQDLQALKVALDVRNWFSKGNVSNGSVDGAGSLYRETDTTRSTSTEEIEVVVSHLCNTRMKLLISRETLLQFAQSLHDCGKTSVLLSAPSTKSEVTNVTRYERIVVNSLVELRALQKKVDKHNKALSNEESMSLWGQEYEEVRRIWNSSDLDPIFIGFDVETYELGHDDILEVGWSIVGPQQEQETFHYIIEESYVDGLHNGRYVADNRRTFLFGKVLEKPLVGSFPNWKRNGTEIATVMDVGRRFSKVVKGLRQKGPVYMVFHDSKGDMKVLDELNIDTGSWSTALLKGKGAGKISRSDQTSSQDTSGDPRLSSLVDDEVDAGKGSKGLHPVCILDTQLLFAALRCGGTNQKKGLQSICIGLDVNGGVLGAFHNAANDAHYTAAALCEMAKGPHFTVMKAIAEERMAEHEQRTKQSTSKKPKFRSWSAASSTRG